MVLWIVSYDIATIWNEVAQTDRKKISAIKHKKNCDQWFFVGKNLRSDDFLGRTCNFINLRSNDKSRVEQY